MERSRRIALLMPIFFLLFSLWILTSCASMGFEEARFPLMVGSFILIVAACEFCVTWRKESHKDIFAHSNILKVTETTLAILLYVVLLKRIGYFICTALLGTYLMYVLGYQNLKKHWPYHYALQPCHFLLLGFYCECRCQCCSSIFS